MARHVIEESFVREKQGVGNRSYWTNPAPCLHLYAMGLGVAFVGDDRGDRFTHYKTILTLAHYVIASQEKPLVEVFTRESDGSWTCVKYEAGQKFALSALECEIEVDQVYAGVFDVEPEYVSVD